MSYSRADFETEEEYRHCLNWDREHQAAELEADAQADNDVHSRKEG